ncbi:MAG TPA: hydrogenase maturation protease [Caldilineae bacterium]|nr:hydrogenase maturation protease [Caldilineae bacterium]
MTTLILGIGNEWASDDGVGPEVVRRLQGRWQKEGREPDREVEFSILAQPDLSLLDRIAGYSDLIVVDAVVGGQPPGTIHRETWEPGMLVERGVQRASSHGFGVHELLEMAAVMGKLPPRVQLIGIEIASTEPGQGLSATVAQAVEGVMEELAEMVGAKGARAI